MEKREILEARSITSSLKRVHQTMEAGVHQAGVAVSVLSRDGDYLTNTLDEHRHHLKGALSLTKMRLNRVKTAEAREKWLLFFAIMFFTGVSLFVVLRRTRILQLVFVTAMLILSPSSSPSTAPQTPIHKSSLSTLPLSFLSSPPQQPTSPSLHMISSQTMPAGMETHTPQSSPSQLVELDPSATLIAEKYPPLEIAQNLDDTIVIELKDEVEDITLADPDSVEVEVEATMSLSVSVSGDII